MSEMRVTMDGRHWDFDPAATVGIGRAPDNDVVIADPTVSRHHARLHFDGNAWVLEAMGSRPTYVNGAPVTVATLSGPAEIRLVTPEGPRFLLSPAGAQPPTAAYAASSGDGTRGGPGVATGSATFGGGGFLPAPPVGVPGPPPGAGIPGPPPGAVPMPPPGAGVGPRTPGAEGELAAAVHILFPLRSWFHEPGWRQGFRLLVVPYALLPCIYLATLSNSTRPATPGWAYALYVAPLWAIAFWFLIRPGRVTREVVVAGAAIGVIVYIWLHAITVNINAGLNPASFGDALGVGFNEESTKALPVLIVALFVLKVRKTKWDVRMWMWLGTISGLVFGVVEASEYTSNSVVTIFQHPNTVIAEILSFAERVFVDGYQHAIWAGVSCFFIGIAVNYPKRRVQLVVAGIAMAAVLHACNDFVLSGANSLALWIVVQTVSLLIFLGYTMSAEMIVRNVRRSSIFRGQSLLAEPPSSVAGPS